VTFCLAVRCVDGVAIAADSLWIRWTDYGPGSPRIYKAARGVSKILWVGPRIAFVPAGTFRRELEGLGAEAEERDFDAIAQSLFDDLGDALHPEGVNDNGYGVVVAGMDGETPAVRRLESDSAENIERAGVGQLVPCGGLRAWHDRLEEWELLDDLRVDAAVELVTAHCFAYVSDVYQRRGYRSVHDWPGIRGEPGGLLPAFAFPIDVATISARGASVARVEEPSLERGRELLEVLGLEAEASALRWRATVLGVSEN
jgi:hypothetical protein